MHRPQLHRPLQHRALRWAWLPLLAGLLVAWNAFAGGAALVVYCAHDSLYADELLRAFEQRTGQRVRVVYDTEATKSLQLIDRIEGERSSPGCDVLWNNEVLGTMRLCELGLLLPYRGPGHARIPQPFKDPDARWTGFAARMRVWIVNTSRMPTPATAQAIDQVLARGLAANELTRVAIAKPLFGTTRTHYTVLWHKLGAPWLQSWHALTRAANISEVSGNALVKDLVSNGACDLGLTDTDDYFVAKDAGEPVAMVPCEVEGQVILIPNTVAIVRGTCHLAAAEQLVDFLLSAEAESLLARSRSRQIPLGPCDASTLPAEVQELMPLTSRACESLELMAPGRACLAWLRSVYAR